MRSGFRIIDGDGHMQEPPDIWEKYVEANYKDFAPKVIGTRNYGRAFLYAPNIAFPNGTINRPEAANTDTPIRFPRGSASGWSLEARLADMDDEGIDIMICFPTNGGGGGGANVPPDAQAAVARAYNNWARDYCHDSHGRVQFIARLPRDLNELIREIQRTASWKEIAAYGPPHPQAVGPAIVTETYDPLWRALVEADSAACFHGGGSQFTVYNTWRTAKLEPVSHALTCMVDGQLAMAGLIFGGVLDRFRQLRVAFYESNAAWVPAWLSKMDDHAVGRQARFIEGHRPQRKPSEIFREQCFVACDADEGDLGHAVDVLDAQNIIFNTDYPHGDSPMPGAVGMFLEQPISDEAKRKILWDNPLQLYGSRVNPSVARTASAAAA